MAVSEMLNSPEAQAPLSSHDPSSLPLMLAIAASSVAALIVYKVRSATGETGSDAPAVGHHPTTRARRASYLLQAFTGGALGVNTVSDNCKLVGLCQCCRWLPSMADAAVRPSGVAKNHASLLLQTTLFA